MNDDILQGSSRDERAIARTLESIAAEMQVPPAFEKRLESHLLQIHGQKQQAAPSRLGRLLPAVGWVMAAVLVVLVVNWGARSLNAQNAAPASETDAPAPAFIDEVQSGAICEGPLVVGHDSSVFFIDPAKPEFVEVDEKGEIDELRAFSWSFDGQSLAIAGVTIGGSNLYLLDPYGESLQALVEDSRLGYLNGVAWSWDGVQLLTLESSKASEFYVVDRATGQVKAYELPGYFIRTLQFSPDGKVMFDGADQTTTGLFQFELDSLQPELISGLVESTGSFAWSPDGTRLAYIEADRSAGKARLVVEDDAGKAVIATLPIPTGAGSSIPGTGNMSWTSDGKAVVFEFGQYINRRAVYLAPVDGGGLVKLAEPAYAPAVSPDGRCLAYISDRQVFLMDLAARLEQSDEDSEPILLGELPSGRGRSNVQMDRLQWQPSAPANDP